VLDLDLCGLGEWNDPAGAVNADHGSTQRLLAATIAAMIGIMNERAQAERPSDRRELEEQFHECDAVCRALGSLLKSP
jgi:hypothetical protein